MDAPDGTAESAAAIPNTTGDADESSQRIAHHARFGFWDVVAVIVGIVVGTAIFKTPTLVFQNTTGPWQALGLWVAGGALSLCGAFVYAELATTYPRNGGDYEYLSRAYGRFAGFLFGWAQLTAILSGSIAAMAYAFGDYAIRLFSLDELAALWLAALAIVLISGSNLLGVVAGKSLQNVLSLAKVLGLSGIVIGGLFLTNPATVSQPVQSPELMGPGLGLALVFVLYAFGGWNDAAFVAAEVRNPHRNVPWALMVGIGGITAVYLAVNVAILKTLGFDAARQSYAPAADVMERTLGPVGAKTVSLLVMISALGAINGMILTGSRIYATVGVDHPLFARLGRWNRRVHAPVNAIVVQGMVSLSLILAVGTQTGQFVIDRLLKWIALPAIPWEQYFGGFETLVAGTAPVFWGFFLLTGVAAILLRVRDPHRERPFRMPGYPLPVVLFCVSCGYMLYSSVAYARWLTLIGFLPLMAGVFVYCGSSRISASGEPDKSKRGERDPLSPPDA